MQPAFATQPSVGLIPAGQQAASQWAPGRNAHTELQRRRHMLALNISFDQGVFKLQRNDALVTSQLGDGLGSP